MFSHMMRYIKNSDIAIDLGTSKTAIFVRGEGVVWHEPSVISMRQRRSGSNEVVAVGEEAQRMRGKEPEGLSSMRPLHGGVIEHLEAAKMMLQEMVRKTQIRRGLVRPRVVIGAPYAISDIERRAVRETASAIGARSVHVIEEPVAAAIGAGIDISASVANMVVDIGSGITEVVVISLGGIVHAESVRIGGDTISEELIGYFRRHFNLVIGEQTAEALKGSLCDVIAKDDATPIWVKGTDVVSRLPQSRQVRPRDVRHAILGPVNVILDTIKKAFENTPPMLAGDLMDRGIVLTGGGALLKNFDRLLEDDIGVPVRVAKDPLGSVVRGGACVLDQLPQVANLI